MEATGLILIQHWADTSPALSKRRSNPNSHLTPDSPPEGDVIFYQTPAGTVCVEVLFHADTFGLSQKRMAELFGVDLRTVSYHLKKIYGTGELCGKSN